MIMGLMLVLTVLILLFRSVIQPFTILLSLPLAIGGVAAALILTNNPLSMPVLIGILMLMGIVTKNAILLIDFRHRDAGRGMNRIQAVVEAGHKRARPIVMTSIAMSAGMLPSALGVGEGGTFRAPMATAVIGGIIVSTVLSLVVVPAFYLIMDDLSRAAGLDLRPLHRQEGGRARRARRASAGEGVAADLAKDRAACRGMTAPPRRTGRPRRCGRDGERARRSRVRAPGGGTFCGAGHRPQSSVTRASAPVISIAATSIGRRSISPPETSIEPAPWPACRKVASSSDTSASPRNATSTPPATGWMAVGTMRLVPTIRYMAVFPAVGETYAGRPASIESPMAAQIVDAEIMRTLPESTPAPEIFGRPARLARHGASARRFRNRHPAPAGIACAAGRLCGAPAPAPRSRCNPAPGRL
jgi:hypothetical protein